MSKYWTSRLARPRRAAIIKSCGRLTGQTYFVSVVPDFLRPRSPRKEALATKVITAGRSVESRQFGNSPAGPYNIYQYTNIMIKIKKSDIYGDYSPRGAFSVSRPMLCSPRARIFKAAL